jgi:hypothetical protein
MYAQQALAVISAVIFVLLILYVRLAFKKKDIE